MSTFTIINTTSLPAMLVISQGAPGGRDALFGRVAVAAHGGHTIIPARDRYTASASITMEDGNTYRTSLVDLPSGSQTLTAQILIVGGTFNLQLTTTPGAVPDQIALLNTGRQPVTFELSAVSPNPVRPVLNAAVVVGPLATAAVSTAESYMFQAIINGITTASVTTTPAQSGRNLTVTIFPEDVAFGDWPAYAVRVE